MLVESTQHLVDEIQRTGTSPSPARNGATRRFLHDPRIWQPVPGAHVEQRHDGYERLHGAGSSIRCEGGSRYGDGRSEIEPCVGALEVDSRTISGSVTPTEALTENEEISIAGSGRKSATLKIDSRIDQMVRSTSPLPVKIRERLEVIGNRVHRVESEKECLAESVAIKPMQRRKVHIVDTPCQ